MKNITMHRGFSMIEILVTLVILMMGLMGLAGVVLQSQKAEQESYQRAQALLLLDDISSKIMANNTAAACYAITTDTTAGTPFMGTSSTVTPACAAATAVASNLANNDLNAWNSLLLGAAEKTGGNSVGAMVGARGCVSYNTVTKEYQISIAWQGMSKTFAPKASLSCGKDLYGDETQRRVVTKIIQIPTLT